MEEGAWYHMTFSVIIPVHNADKYLSDTLGSIIRQKSEGTDDLEIVLVENGSIDKSAMLCDEYASKYDYINVVHKGAIGAYAARREGMKEAGGDWLIFVDADDALKENAIADLSGFVGSFTDYNTAPDVILYNWDKLQSGKVTSKHYPFENGKVYRDNELQVFYDLMCDGDSLNALWNKCIKMTLADKIITSGEMGFMNHGEDLLQTAEILDKAESVAFLEKSLYLYRCNDEGLSGSYHSHYLPNQIMAWDRFKAYTDKWSDGDGRYKDRIDARKTLTCTIAVKTLIYSKLKRNEKDSLLKQIEESSFYREYALKELPKWAPEEDVYVHDLQIHKNAHKMLMRSALKHDIKAFIKARIHN